LTCHTDGTCTIFDISREDSVSGSWQPIRGLTVKKGVEREEDAQEVLLERSPRLKLDARSMTMDSVTSRSSTSSVVYDAGRGESLQGKPSIQSWDPTTRILVTRPAAQEANGDNASKRNWPKLNPVAHWRVTKSSAITDVAFSPDHTKVAVVSTDGLLRIINLLSETLEGTFESYYGALNKVVFSPDAKFLLTAGCDDLISVWTSDGRLLSRCPGHSSFVTGLAFDPWKWKVEDRTYRFASVGEDGRVFLWDFSSAALVRPKGRDLASTQRKGGIHGGSTHSLLQQDQYQRRFSSGPTGRNSISAERSEPAYLRAPPRIEVAELQPVASFQLASIASGDHVQSAIPPSASVSSTATAASSLAGIATGNGNPQATATPANHAAVTGNEAGSANDLLVDVRFRPDGLLIMHKSGTLRFLQRPRHRATSRSAAMARQTSVVR
jgi:hypothetical protein